MAELVRQVQHTGAIADVLIEPERKRVPHPRDLRPIRDAASRLMMPDHAGKGTQEEFFLPSDGMKYTLHSSTK